MQISFLTGNTPASSAEAVDADFMVSSSSAILLALILSEPYRRSSSGLVEAVPSSGKGKPSAEATGWGITGREGSRSRQSVQHRGEHLVLTIHYVLRQ